MTTRNAVIVFFAGLACGAGIAAYHFITTRPAAIMPPPQVVVQAPPVSPPAPMPPSDPRPKLPEQARVEPAPATPAPSSPAPGTPKPATPEPAAPVTQAPAPATPVPTASAQIEQHAPGIPPKADEAVTKEKPGDRQASAATMKSDALPIRARDLIVPVDGIRPEQLSDTYNQLRGGTRPHEALDIMAPRGTPVRAVADGTIVKLFDSKPGGLTIYAFDPTQTVAFYYAHLDRYAAGITEGMQVRQGEVIGYVGSTGNASPNAPHLHFAIFKLGPEKRWWQGTPVNPFPYFVQ